MSEAVIAIYRESAIKVCSFSSSMRVDPFYLPYVLEDSRLKKEIAKYLLAESSQYSFCFSKEFLLSVLDEVDI